MGENASRHNRYTVRDAADILGISEGAVRNRLSRGTLEGVKVGETTYVVLVADTDDIPPTHEPTDYRDELIEELRDRVRSLERANEENRRLLAAALQMRELESRVDNRNSANEPPASARGESTEGSGSPGRARPWWRRLLGR